jgi:hypothetical protein
MNNHAYLSDPILKKWKEMKELKKATLPHGVMLCVQAARKKS